MHDPERWRAMLLESQLAYENGEITEAELAVREREILARLRELHSDSIGVVLSTEDPKASTSKRTSATVPTEG